MHTPATCFWEIAHQSGTRFEIEPTTSSWGILEEYFGIFWPRSGFDNFSKVRSDLHRLVVPNLLFLLAWVYASEFPSQTLFVVKKRDFYDLLGHYVIVSSHEGNFMNWSNCGRMKMKSWVREHLSVTRWWKTPWNLFLSAKHIVGEVKDLTLILVEISKLTLKAKHPDLKSASVWTAETICFCCPLGGYKCSSLAVACSEVGRWDS